MTRPACRASSRGRRSGYGASHLPGRLQLPGGTRSRRCARSSSRSRRCEVAAARRLSARQRRGHRDGRSHARASQPKITRRSRRCEDAAGGAGDGAARRSRSTARPLVPTTVRAKIGAEPGGTRPMVVVLVTYRAPARQGRCAIAHEGPAYARGYRGRIATAIGSISPRRPAQGTVVHRRGLLLAEAAAAIGRPSSMRQLATSVIFAVVLGADRSAHRLRSAVRPGRAGDRSERPARPHHLAGARHVRRRRRHDRGHAAPRSTTPAVTSVTVNGVAAVVHADGTFERHRPGHAGHEPPPRGREGRAGQHRQGDARGRRRPDCRRSTARSPQAITATMSAQTFDAIGRGAGGLHLAAADLGALIAPMNPVVDIGHHERRARLPLRPGARSPASTVGRRRHQARPADRRHRPRRRRSTTSASTCTSSGRWRASTAAATSTVAASKVRIRGLLAARHQRPATSTIKPQSTQTSRSPASTSTSAACRRRSSTCSTSTRASARSSRWATRDASSSRCSTTRSPASTRPRRSTCSARRSTSRSRRRASTSTCRRRDRRARHRAARAGRRGVAGLRLRHEHDPGDGQEPRLPARGRRRRGEPAARQLLGRQGHGARRSTSRTARYGEVGKLYDRVELSAKVPPFVDANGDGLRLTIGDMLATFKNGASIATQVAINAQVDAPGRDRPRRRAAPRRRHARRRTSTSSTRTSTASNLLSNAQFEAISSFALSRIVAVGSGAVGAIPLPSVGGVSMQNVQVLEQTGYLIVDGEIQ